MPTVDVLIVGAGPSGSTAATALVEHGHSVAVIERLIRQVLSTK